APEYGATCGIFPVDAETLAYLRLTGRTGAQVARVEAYCKEQGVFRTTALADPVYTDVMELDLSKVEPCLAGPSRPQDRVPLGQVKKSFVDALPSLQIKKKAGKKELPQAVETQGPEASGLPANHGSVVIAAITSCTNTSNPSVLVAAGLVAKKAAERG